MQGKPAEVEQLEMQAKRDTAQKRRAAIERFNSDRADQAIAECLALPETHALRQGLEWSAAATKGYAAFKCLVNECVGMEKLKAFIADEIDDAVGRYALGESLNFRHVLLAGDLGSGKHTAAQQIARLAVVLGGWPRGAAGPTVNAAGRTAHSTARQR